MSHMVWVFWAVTLEKKFLGAANCGEMEEMKWRRLGGAPGPLHLRAVRTGRHHALLLQCAFPERPGLSHSQNGPNGEKTPWW